MPHRPPCLWMEGSLGLVPQTLPPLWKTVGLWTEKGALKMGLRMAFPKGSIWVSTAASQAVHCAGTLDSVSGPEFKGLNKVLLLKGPVVCFAP